MNSSEKQLFRIAMINAADEAGGAESVARGLRTELVRKGHKVDFWVGRRNSTTDAHAVRVIPATDKQRAAARRYADHGFFNLGCPAAREFCESPALGSVDLIHLHNLHGHYFSIRDVPRLAARAPLVWTLHDFFPITGGCAFPIGCERWRDRCGQCPQLGEYPLMTPFDRTRRLLSIKRHTFRELRATLVVPSEHLARAVRSSGMFPRAAIEVFPYGVDTTLFRPGRVEARKGLGLLTDNPIIMLAAQSLTEKRKNAAEAVEAIAAVQDLRPTVILIGGGEVDVIRTRLSGCDVRALGYVANRDELARCYAAADLLLFTSRADNFPCVIQESFACGTTVLAQSIDATREMIIDGETGFVVPAGERDKLARTLRSLISNHALLAEAGAAARGYAERHWSTALNIARHEALYARVVGSREVSAPSGSCGLSIRCRRWRRRPGRLLTSVVVYTHRRARFGLPRPGLVPDRATQKALRRALGPGIIPALALGARNGGDTTIPALVRGARTSGRSCRVRSGLGTKSFVLRTRVTANVGLMIRPGRRITRFDYLSGGMRDCGRSLDSTSA